MSIKKITSKQRKNGMKYCTFCKPEKVHAIWKDGYGNFACEDHKNKLYEDSDRMTEADYQTWYRI